MAEAVNTHQETKTTLVSNKESHDNISTSWKENIDGQNTYFYEWSNDLRENLNQAGEDVQRFIVKDLTEDLPTGTKKKNEA